MRAICLATLVLALTSCSKQAAVTAPAVGKSIAQPVTAVAPQNTAPAAAVATQSPPVLENNPSQPAPVVPVTASDEVEGPFHIGGLEFSLVKHLQKIQGAKSEDDTTVASWEFRDAAGGVVYREQYQVNFQGGTFEETYGVTARELKGKFGQGILVQGGSLPSAPNSGWWVRLFGLFDKKLVPFSPAISTAGEFVGEDVTSFEPTPVFRGQQIQPVGHDILKFHAWAGSFGIEYNVIIDWLQAKVRPEWTCSQMTSKGRSSACRYRVQAEPQRGSEMTFVRLFSEPDEGFVPKHVVIKPESKVEFLEAQAAVSWSSSPNGLEFGPSDSERMWLHIKVDGQDGWISGEEDFQAVGLSQSG